MKLPQARATFPALIGILAVFASNAAAQKPAGDVQAAWDNLLHDAIPKATPDPVLTQTQVPVKPRAAGDFLNHFYFEARTEYTRADTSFNNVPTLTGVINAPFTGVFNPNGYPYQAAFQPDANRLVTFWDWGTRGWGSDRVDSHFSLRYRTDLTKVNLASPNANILETWHGDRQFEFLTASVTVNSKPTDGMFAGSSLQLGRQHVYGAELADIDGASFTLNRQNYSFDIFGGRRFSYYSDPDQRAIGGAGATWRINDRTSVSYQGMVYIRASHRVSFRRRLTSNLSVVSYFRAYGGAPVDFDAEVFYHPRNGKTTLRAAFFQKLSNKDYNYDYTVSARDLDKYNPLYRLYLGPIPQYSQLVVDARRTFAPWFSLGGTVWVRHLNDSTDQGAFDTSFQDYRLNAQIFPLKKLQTSFEYHQRNSDRLPPDPNTTFDDTSRAGETKVIDLTSEIRRTFGEGGRLTLSGGVYYRRFNIQDRFQMVNGIHQSGWLSAGSVKVDQHTRVFFDYSLDNDFFLFRPTIQNARLFRVGLVWKY